LIQCSLNISANFSALHAQAETLKMQATMRNPQRSLQLQQLAEAIAQFK